MTNGPNIDEKLRAARERREEQLKLLGMRASRGGGAAHPAGLMHDTNLLINPPQPIGRRTGWSGSSGPGSTTNSS